MGPIFCVLCLWPNHAKIFYAMLAAITANTCQEITDKYVSDAIFLGAELFQETLEDENSGLKEQATSKGVRGYPFVKFRVDFVEKMQK